MEIRLDDSQVTELRQLLSGALSELSSEIANTDNAEYRRTLRERREHLERLRRQLEAGDPEHGS
jgi:hypothetical protein